LPATEMEAAASILVSWAKAIGYCKILARSTFSLGVLLLIGVGSSRAGTLFGAPHTYGSGGESTVSVAVADLNGDNIPDLVLANQNGDGSGSLAVLLGNGDGTFKAPQNYAFGNATSVAVGDVNGDGKPDLLVTGGFSGGLVGVLLGNGDGTFQPAHSYSSGEGLTFSIAAGDLNGDGKLDLVVGSSSSGSDGAVSVLLGNGDGSFQSAQFYDSGGGCCGPYGENGPSVVVADVNGDGKPDVLASNAGLSGHHGAIGVLLGHGDGTFQDVQTYDSGGFVTTSIAAADVNGDGKLDVVVANGYRGNAGVLIGNGDGTFRKVHNYDLGGQNPTSIAAGDVNRDGKVDLLVANQSGPGVGPGVVAVLLGNGDGTFQAVQNYNSGGNLATSLALADVNGDGKRDIVVANYIIRKGNGNVGVLLGKALYNTQTNLSSSQNPSTFGQPVTFKASVVSSGSILPTGIVGFASGGVTVGSATLSGGVASLTLTESKLPVGTLSITATYKGDSQSGISTSPVLLQVVNPASLGQ